MTTPFWCLLIVAIIPYVLSTLGGYFRMQQLGSIDNNHPRIQVTALTGVGARVYAAQMNAWEGLAFFATAVFMAHLAGADPSLSATAAMIYLVTRVLHPILYIADMATLRSVVFLTGLGSGFWLLCLACRA